LKYNAELPIAVTIIGGLHGILLIAFALLAWEVKGNMKKTGAGRANHLLPPYPPLEGFGWIISIEKRKKRLSGTQDFNL